MFSTKLLFKIEDVHISMLNQRITTNNCKCLIELIKDEFKIGFMIAYINISNDA